MTIIYILLAIIAVGVLVQSNIWKEILVWILILSGIWFVIYLLFWWIIIIISIVGIWILYPAILVLSFVWVVFYVKSSSKKYSNQAQVETQNEEIIQEKSEIKKEQETDNISQNYYDILIANKREEDIKKWQQESKKKK
jgi:hypothetical protein